MTDMPAAGAALRPLRRFWWLPPACIVAALAASAVITSRQASVYRATCSLVAAPNEVVQDTSDVLRTLDTLERRGVVATLAKIPAAPATMQEVARELGVDPRELRGHALAASVPPYTYVLIVEATGPDAQRVADIANAAAVVVDRKARELYRIFTLRPIAEATKPRAPIHPNPSRNHVVAGLLGLFVGVVAAYAIDGFSRLHR
jgi:capsular polysaccharide biosynthesis protein